MHIKLYIKTEYRDEAENKVEDVLSNISEELIESKKINLKAHWELEHIIIAEVELNLNKAFDENMKRDFLYRIADKWLRLRTDRDEAIASQDMKDCRLNYNLELADVYF